jgi:hypothetical protein
VHCRRGNYHVGKQGQLGRKNLRIVNENGHVGFAVTLAQLTLAASQTHQLLEP